MSERQGPKPDQTLEQFIVSASVIRQGRQMPPELVEYHREVLSGFGIVGEALNGLLSMNKDEFIKLLDRLQNG